ncbi:TetR/AcrR family transcriptional regulator [Streptomyces chiangmaiensis]
MRRTSAAGGLRAATTDRIAARSGVSKATIYKWWPNKYAVALEAFLSQMDAESPDPDTGSAAEDFRLTVRGMMRFYASPIGRIFAQLLAESQNGPKVASELARQLVTSRRGLVRAIWDRGVQRGELRADVDPDVALDLFFGPLVYRLMAGHAPLDEKAADEVVRVALCGLAR